MSKLAILIVTLIGIGASQALICKKCADAKCESLQDETCAIEAGKKEAVCLTHVYKDANKVEMTEKKCINKDIGVKYECNNTLVEGIKCETCSENFCNNAGWKNGGGDAMLVALLAAFACLKMLV